MGTDLLVIGCGNLLASDDAIGLHLIWSLQTSPLPEGVEVIEAGTPGLNLLHMWEGRKRVLIVDAVKSGSPPGTVHCFDSSSLPPREFIPLSAHGINLLDAIELGKRLGNLPPVLRIIGVEILSEEPYHEGLSPEVERALPVAVDRTREEIQRML